MEDCIFCKIAQGVLPSQKVYEDDLVLAFEDVAPQAPVHVVVIPKAHVGNLLECEALPDETLAGMLRAAALVAARKGLTERGFRVVSNCGEDACQSVRHLHLHVLGGRPMGADLA